MLKTSYPRRILARIPRCIRRPVYVLFGNEMAHLVLAGFLVGAVGYIGIISDAARAELISNFSVLV